MQLKFFARADMLVTLPGERRIVGQPPEYVGRRCADGQFPATADGFTCDSQSEAGIRLAKLARRDASLWAGDRNTAAHCGVPFVDLVFKDGEWTPKPPAKADKKD